MKQRGTTGAGEPPDHWSSSSSPTPQAGTQYPWTWHRHYPGKGAETTMRGRYLGPAALIGPHGRGSWWVRFGGTAHLCATEHLRGVTPDEADCLALDERRQLDELLRAAREVPENYEDLTSQLGPPPPVEVPTEPPREPEEPSRDDLDIGMDAVEQMTRLEGAVETVSSTEIPYGETAGSPQCKGVHLEESRGHTHDEVSRGTQLINSQFFSGQTSV